ncbi:hypothetical protein [Agrococcus sp. UYP33]
MLAVILLLGLAGCTADPGPAPLTQAQLGSFAAAVDTGSTTVGEAAALAPAGTLGLIEVRVEPGTGPVEHASYGAPPEDFLDWIVIGHCGMPDAVPSIEIAAVAPAEADAFDRAGGFDLVCDGPPAAPEDG